MPQALLKCIPVIALSWLLTAKAQQPDRWIDPSPHRVQLVPVEEDVRLEVLDWGGNGRNIIILPGLAETSHVFDDFATKLVREYQYHVYGITRRGFGRSSRPALDRYNADRLADDIIAVIKTLGIAKPVLAGHSIAGSELTSIGTKRPNLIAGLVYLDARYWYAYDSREANLDRGSKRRSGPVN